MSVCAHVHPEISHSVQTLRPIRGAQGVSRYWRHCSRLDGRAAQLSVISGSWGQGYGPFAPIPLVVCCVQESGRRNWHDSVLAAAQLCAAYRRPGAASGGQRTRQRAVAEKGAILKKYMLSWERENLILGRGRDEPQEGAAEGDRAGRLGR